jgi:hypothetical protein
MLLEDTAMALLIGSKYARKDTYDRDREVSIAEIVCKLQVACRAWYRKPVEYSKVYLLIATRSVNLLMSVHNSQSTQKISTP